MQPVTAAPKPGLLCSHCGREVSETVHTRTAYRVDYYALHTGAVEPVILQRPDDSMPAVTVLRLVHPMNVFTCVDCYAEATVQAERERLFRPERAAVAQSAES